MEKERLTREDIERKEAVKKPMPFFDFDICPHCGKPLKETARLDYESGAYHCSSCGWEINEIFLPSFEMKEGIRLTPEQLRELREKEIDIMKKEFNSKGEGWKIKVFNKKELKEIKELPHLGILAMKKLPVDMKKLNRITRTLERAREKGLLNNEIHRVLKIHGISISRWTIDRTIPSERKRMLEEVERLSLDGFIEREEGEFLKKCSLHKKSPTFSKWLRKLETYPIDEFPVEEMLKDKMSLEAKELLKKRYEEKRQFKAMNDTAERIASEMAKAGVWRMIGF